MKVSRNEFFINTSSKVVTTVIQFPALKISTMKRVNESIPRANLFLEQSSPVNRVKNTFLKKNLTACTSTRDITCVSITHAYVSVSVGICEPGVFLKNPLDNLLTYLAYLLIRSNRYQHLIGSADFQLKRDRSVMRPWFMIYVCWLVDWKENSSVLNFCLSFFSTPIRDDDQWSQNKMKYYHSSSWNFVVIVVVVSLFSRAEEEILKQSQIESRKNVLFLCSLLSFFLSFYQPLILSHGYLEEKDNKRDNVQLIVSRNLHFTFNSTRVCFIYLTG